MKIKLLTVLTIMLLLIVGLVFSAGKIFVFQKGKQPIRFCYLIGTEAVPVLIAKNQRFFEKEGLDVKLFNLDQQRGVEYSLVGSNVLDGCATGKIGAIKSASMGMPIKVVGNLLQNEGPPVFTFVVKKSSNISSLNYFKGKDFGLTFGSGPEYFFDKILEKEKINRSDINVLAMPLTDRIASFRSDKLEGIIADPIVYQDLKSDYELINLAESTDVMPNSYVDGVIFSNEFVKSNPNEVAKIMRAIYKASAFINENSNKNSRLIKDILKKEDGTPGWEKIALSTYATDSKGLKNGMKEIFKWLKNGEYLTEYLNIDSVIYSIEEK